MLEKEGTLEVRNIEIDGFSSIMLDDFKEHFMHYDGIRFIAAEKPQREGEKCELTLLVSFAISLSAGVASGIIIELLKNVYTHHVHPKDYKWKLFLKSDKCSKIIVYKEDGVILVDIQDVNQKGN